MPTPVSDKVRIKSNTSVKLVNASDEFIENKVSVKSREHPPNATSSNLGDVANGLYHNLIHQTSSKTSITSAIIYYLNHTILLFVFLFISIYRNFHHLYERITLKYLTLAYYPSKSPQVIRDDVSKLTKIPKRMACILDLKDDDDENGGVDGLINQVSELSAWALSAGITSLTIYEYNGLLSTNHRVHLPLLTRELSKNLATYFGTELIPLFSFKIPHKNLVVYSDPSAGPNGDSQRVIDLEITLLSRIDGKPTIVELTKTMSELAQAKELSVNDISIDLIDEELIELVGPEPDLLVSFGPTLDLQDFPPWHIRLTEIYWEPGNKDVNYAVFIRALQKFSNCKVNVGR